MKQISDKQIRDFLLNAVFGDDYKNDYVAAASNRAYRDFNRTIRFKANVDDEQRRKTKDEVTSIIIKDSIEKNVKGLIDEDTFAKFHKTVCKKIVTKYDETIAEKFYYGQAQKWLNMTIKYMFILHNNPLGLDSAFKYCHIPIDNYIMDEATKRFGIDRPKGENRKAIPWSKWDEETYIVYQKKLQKHIRDKYNKAPLSWEFDAWLNAPKK